MSYRAIMAAAAAMTICLSGTQAFAQAQGNAAPKGLGGGPSNRSSMTEVEQRMNMEKMFDDPASSAKMYDSSGLIAHCVVKLSGDKAGALLGGPGTSDPRYTKLSNAMTGRYTSCLRGASAKSLSPALLTSAISEELVKRGDATGVADRAPNVNIDTAKAFHGDLNGPVTIVEIARCEAVYSTGLVHKVLATRPGSPEELNALGTLYSQTPECGISTTPSGVGQVLQRSALADALYAWSQQNKAK